MVEIGKTRVQIGYCLIMAARLVCLQAVGIVGQIITHVHKYKYNNISLAWFPSLSALSLKHYTNHHIAL